MMHSQKHDIWRDPGEGTVRSAHTPALYNMKHPVLVPTPLLSTSPRGTHCYMLAKAPEPSI